MYHKRRNQTMKKVLCLLLVSLFVLCLVGCDGKPADNNGGNNTPTEGYSFTYNDDGIRTSKTVNGVKTTYYLSGSQILAEVTPSYEIMYIYDAAGAPVGMQYRSFTYANGVYDVYFFEKSLQGDILAVYGADGTKYIEYTYDSWGSFTTTYHNGGENTSAVNNRFTYRG